MKAGRIIYWVLLGTMFFFTVRGMKQRWFTPVDLAGMWTRPALGKELAQTSSEPGLSARRVGPLRIYVAAAAEVTRMTAANDEVRSPVFGQGAFPVGWKIVKPATHTWNVWARALPILITFENDTYGSLPFERLHWSGQALCTVLVSRVLADGATEDVFARTVPLPERRDWLTAERRSAEVDWPLGNVAEGDYKISVEVPLADHPVVEVVTRVL